MKSTKSNWDVVTQNAIYFIFCFKPFLNIFQMRRDMVCDFIDFVCEFTETTKHTVASYESSDFTWEFLTVHLIKAT
jgi:hypothetical protein